MQGTIEKLVDLIESYFASSFCILLHNLCRIFLRVGSTDLSVSTQIKSKRFHVRIFALLHWNSPVDTFGMYPINLFTSRGQHKIYGQIHTVHMIPIFFSFNQHLIIPKRDFWYWACNFFDCIGLSFILFELLTKRLQNRRNRFWRVRVQQRSLHLRVHPLSLPSFLCMLFIVALHGYFDSPAV